MQVILTRPQPQQAAWAQGLREQGIAVQSLPLIEIAAAPDVAWPAGKSFSVLMFVSGNAVEHFFKSNSRQVPVEYSLFAINNIANNKTQLRCWVTGPGTVIALKTAGIDAQRIDAPAHDAGQFDSEALWQQVRDQIKLGSQALIVRGRDVGSPDVSRDWLAQQIEAAGGQASSLVVYERRAPVFTPQQLQDAQRWLHDGSAWLFSSSQAVGHLPAQLDVSKATCICTHARIALAAKERGFAVVCTSRPMLQDVVASIKSLS
jgi:uroporphyrinogen-III synthase